MKNMHTTPAVFSRPHQNVYRIGWKKMCGCFLMISIPINLFPGALVSTAWATTSETSSHQIKTLAIPFQAGSIPKTLTFPVYEQESIQYFSAGLGKEERSLTYPDFSLKLIFVQGERAFLAGVSVHIAKEDGTQLLTIPGEEVEGPWLYINLPAGTYAVGGTDSNGTTIKKTITLPTSKSTVVHFRWP